MAPTAPLKNFAARSAGTINTALAHRPIIIDRDETSGLEPFRRLISRNSNSEDGSDKMINALITVLVLAFVSIILISTLYFFRRSRRLQKLRNQSLPTYNDASKEPMLQHSLTIETKHNGRSSIVVIGRDGQPMLQNPNSPPDSPDNVPEIHITFPDEQGDDGRRKSGRVLIVRVGDNAAVGLEPVREEQLPAYEKEAKGQFQSIDMDKIGGLKEKDRSLFQ
ncbi:hypothetical protein CCM_01850 [Cordyceps militaris CM01]|uniref:Herpesvirus latent membrane 1 (LMP1) domain-containing protein n=1 Tax=Cordyceps militaris (strain CM01) TaxID=983644 RepID=G3J7X9_CORMM|nr:uncharacterized protein CCM_01850 [Cordyceps militaris CM01]EGX97190.1 hypothetical protein CCM_01850 [Cordyceps militaris CM01]